MTDEEKQLDLLSMFHWIFGGMTALFACIPLIHVTLGLFLIFGKMDGPNPPPALIGWIFVIIGGFFILCGWTLAAAILVAGFKLKKRRARTYCLVIGSLECILVPFGTVLGVFTLIALMNDSTKRLFGTDAPAPQS